MLDDNTEEERARYDYSSSSPSYKQPGDGGYRMAPWAPSYDPGPNWNNGIAPAPPAPRYDYNGNSPPAQALTPGHGWVWEGPQAPQWNMDTNQWDRGVWQERLGEGFGYMPINPPNPRIDTTERGGNGRVEARSIGGGGAGINVPPASLPPDIMALFNKQPEKTPVQSIYQNALLNFMGRSQETPTLNDSILGPQTEVYRAAAQRGQERNRRAVAERAAANGQSQSGYLDNQINKGIQEQNFNTASFNANLLGGEMKKRREELMAGLQLARATGDAEAERELRERLAQVSASLQQQGLNLQGQLGAGDLALRQLLAQMGDSQFYDSLGVNTALNLEGLNQRALELIMRGNG